MGVRKCACIIGLAFLGTAPLGLHGIAMAGTVPSQQTGTALSPARYISLAPSTTEILFALGLDKEIVGVSSYCNYPAQAAQKEKVGDFSHPNIEKILFLKPDYIFCTGLEQTQTIAELKKLNLKVYVADPVSILELLTTIQDIGKITGRKKESESLVWALQQGIKEVSQEVNRLPTKARPKVFIEIWHDPLMTAGKGTFIDELVTTAGGVNIAHDTKRAYSVFSAEEVIQRNPDCIILAYMDESSPVEYVGKRFGWANINAVKRGHIFNDINPDILLRPGPRVVDGIRQLHKRLFLKK